jgi:hypothetical protein
MAEHAARVSAEGAIATASRGKRMKEKLSVMRACKGILDLEYT